MKKKIKLHKKSIIFGFILSMLMAIFCRTAWDSIVIYLLAFAVKLPIIGDLMKKHFSDKISGIKYTGSGTNIPEEYTVGYVSPGKEGMTADDLINSKKGNKGSENVNYQLFDAIFQAWTLSGGLENILQSEYQNNFKLSWVNDSVMAKTALKGMFGGMLYYAMEVSTKEKRNKNSSSANLNLCMTYIKKNENWLKVFNDMHNLVINVYDGFNLTTVKTKFKNSNINPDTSFLYSNRDMWKKKDESTVNSLKQIFAEWCSNTVLKINNAFMKDTTISLF